MTGAVWDGDAPPGWARDHEGWWRRLQPVTGLFEFERYTRPTPGRFVATCTHTNYRPGDVCGWCGGRLPSNSIEAGSVDGATLPGDPGVLHTGPADTLFG